MATGPWDNTTAWVVNDIVSYNGMSFKCILASTGNDPSTDAGVHWQRIGVPGEGMTILGTGPVYLMAGGSPVAVFESVSDANTFLKGGL